MSLLYAASMVTRKSTSDRRNEEQQAVSRRRLITWFMAAIMVSSIFGFILMNQTQSTANLDYNGFSIESSKVGYQVTLEKGKSLILINHPSSLENVVVEKPVWDLLARARVIGVTYNESDERAEAFGAGQFLLERDLAVSPRIFVQRGLLNASGTNLQSMSCNNATVDFPVLMIGVGDQTKAFVVAPSCVMIQGVVPVDTIRVVDRIILGLAGVMKRE